VEIHQHRAVILRQVVKRGLVELEALVRGVTPAAASGQLPTRSFA